MTSKAAASHPAWNDEDTLAWTDDQFNRAELQSAAKWCDWRTARLRGPGD